MTTKDDVIKAARDIGLFIIADDITDHPTLGFRIDGVPWRDWINEMDVPPYGEEQAIIDYAESPAFDDYYGDDDYDPWDDYDGDDE